MHGSEPLHTAAVAVDSTMAACRQSATSAVAFVPTGWVDSGKFEGGFKVVEKAPWKIHLVPYSEHSSFPELQEFVAFLRPKLIVPTVGAHGEEGDKKVRTRMRKR